MEEGEERSSSSVHSLLPLPTLLCPLWNAWGRCREQCELCVIKSLCVGTEVLWGDRVNSCVHVWRGGGSVRNNCGCS